MVIECFNFAKEPNSTKVPSASGRQITCTLKDDCSIMHPVFLLNSWQMTDNYLKWDSRYYWIEDIIIKSADIAEYHCKEDVLGTFKSAIGSSSQFITRSAHAYTPLLIDGKYPALTGSIKTETKLTQLHNQVKPANNAGFYVVGVQNELGATSGGITYYALGETDMGHFLAFMFGGTWLDTTEAQITIAIQKELINPMQYVSSIVWFPFSTDMYGSFPYEQIKFGWWSASGVYGSRIPTGSFVQTFVETVSLPRHNEANSRGSYLNASPFTRHTLFCYTFGQVSIDPNLFIADASCLISISCDLSTGDARLSIMNGTDAKEYAMYNGRMGTQIQIAQMTQSIIGSAGNIISGSVGLAYGNAVGYGQGIINALESLTPQIERSGSTGSRMWYNVAPTILTEHIQIASEDRSHLGRPLCVRGTVSSYPGFLQVENADIDFACNYSELTEIKSFMESGFYYE